MSTRAIWTLVLVIAIPILLCGGCIGYGWFLAPQDVEFQEPGRELPGSPGAPVEESRRDVGEGGLDDEQPMPTQNTSE